MHVYTLFFEDGPPDLQFAKKLQRRDFFYNIKSPGALPTHAHITTKSFKTHKKTVSQVDSR